MPLIIPYGSRRSATQIGLLEYDALPVGIAEALPPIATTSRLPEAVAVDLAESAVIVGDGRIRQADGLPMRVTELATFTGEGWPVVMEAVPLPLAEQVGLIGVERTGSEAWGVGLGEGSFAGLQESWTGVADTTANVNGFYTWSRLAGTKWSVRGKRAMLAGETAGDGVQIARCETDLGTSDYEVFGTVILDPADATWVVSGVLARLNDLGTEFYQLRVVNWGGSQTVDLWRNTVADSWVRLAGPFSRSIASGAQLRLHVAGTGPVTIIAWLDQELIVAPFDDGAGAITSGSKIGIFAEWTGGTQAQVGMDDVKVRTLGTGAAAYEVLGVDLGAAGLSERVALHRNWDLTEALRLPRFVGYGLSPGAQWPGPSPEELYDITPVVGADGVALGVGEPVGLLSAQASGEPLAVDLAEGAEGAPVQYPDSVAIQWGESAVLGWFREDGEAIGVGVGERGELLTTLVSKPAASVLAAGLTDTAVRTVLTVGFIGLMRPELEGTQVAGATGDTVGIAGPTAEFVVTEA